MILTILCLLFDAVIVPALLPYIFAGVAAIIMTLILIAFFIATLIF